MTTLFSMQTNGNILLHISKKYVTIDMRLTLPYYTVWRVNMLKVIFGIQGVGKSRQMCSEANNRLASARGTVVFIDKDNDHMYDLNRDVRFINASEYGISGYDMLMGFVAGIAARDFDLEALYINSFAKLVDMPVSVLEPAIRFLKKFSDKSGVDVTVSINGADECPDFIKEYCF